MTNKCLNPFSLIFPMNFLGESFGCMMPGLREMFNQDRLRAPNQATGPPRQGVGLLRGFKKLTGNEID